MSEEIQIKLYIDGLKLSFPLYKMADWQFKAITECIKRNRESGKIQVIDTIVSKDEYLVLLIKGIERQDVPEFISLIQSETLQTITPTFCMTNLL